MKIVVIIVAAAVIAASLVADYKWRRWMESRRADRDRGQNDR